MVAPELNAVEKQVFNPAKRLISIKSNKGGGDKPYLPAYDAIAWFWEEFPAPRGRIVPMIIDIENRIVRAEVYVDGQLIGAADVKGDGEVSLEKLETSAVRRALAFAGYGTVGALAHEDDPDESASQARAAIAAEQISTEVARQKMGAGKNRRLNTTEPSSVPDPYANIRSALDEMDFKIDTITPRDTPGTIKVTLNRKTKNIEKFGDWVREKFGKDAILNVYVDGFDMKWPNRERA